VEKVKAPFSLIAAGEQIAHTAIQEEEAENERPEGRGFDL
jgi:hypothetical protein